MFKKIIVFCFVKKHLGRSLLRRGFKFARGKKSYEKKKIVTGCLRKKSYFFVKKHLGCSLLTKGFKFARGKKSYKKKKLSRVV